MPAAMLTIVGNLASDPEVKQTPQGFAVASFTVASTERRQVAGKPGEYEDGPATFIRCSVWRDYAVNVAESLRKGNRVIVTGRLRQDSYEKDGVKRYTYELDVDEVGAVLRFARVQVLAKPVGASSGGRRAAASGPMPGDAPF